MTVPGPGEGARAGGPFRRGAGEGEPVSETGVCREKGLLRPPDLTLHEHQVAKTIPEMGNRSAKPRKKFGGRNHPEAKVGLLQNAKRQKRFAKTFGFQAVVSIRCGAGIKFGQLEAETFRRY